MLLSMLSGGVPIKISKDDLRIAAEALDLTELARNVREATFLGFMRFAAWMAAGALILVFLLGM